MFNKDFFPTPFEVAEQMINGYDLKGKTVLEPSAGKGDLVKVLEAHGANVIACETNQDLRKILSCPIIENDFLKLEKDKISHIDFIFMNPPFSADEKHILHAWEIAPAGCTIVALCNLRTMTEEYSQYLKKIQQIVSENGFYENLEDCFSEAERKTGVRVAMIKITKPADNYKTEFNGFFLEDDEPEQQENGIMSYNAIRDLVQRYIAAVKLYDQQLELGQQMNQLTSGFYSSSHSFSISQEGKPKARAEFKKDLQKSGWEFIFDKMNLQKYATRGLREDINKFVEQQTQIPFTMRNIYQMLEIVVGTTEQRMDKALMEMFDKLTQHYYDNRFNVEGWKTNSHYLLNKRFIFPYAAEKDWDGTHVNFKYWNHGGETLADMEKALCFISGENFDTIKGFRELPPKMIAGQWYSSHFFKLRAYKKGTVHCEFVNEDIWARFNQRIAKLKGFPLPEFKHTKQTDKANAETAKRYRPAAQEILFEVTI